MPFYYLTPEGTSYELFRSMLSQPHLLIAGATGSGKSVLVRGLMQELTLHSPALAQVILIDPKRVELSQFRTIPHVIRYASEPPEMLKALGEGMGLCEERYKNLQRRGLRTWDGSAVYIIIDELADLMTTQKKAVAPLLQRLAQVGRAAGIHLIACTQCPISAVIPTEIKVNFDARVGLRTRSAQDSRNILGCTGCENLPRYGQALYLLPEGLTKWNIPFIPEDESENRVKYWEKHRFPRFTLKDLS